MSLWGGVGSNAPTRGDAASNPCPGSTRRLGGTSGSTAPLPARQWRHQGVGTAIEASSPRCASLVAAAAQYGRADSHQQASSSTQRPRRPNITAANGSTDRQPSSSGPYVPARQQQQQQKALFQSNGLPRSPPTPPAAPAEPGQPWQLYARPKAPRNPSTTQPRPAQPEGDNSSSSSSPSSLSPPGVLRRPVRAAPVAADGREALRRPVRPSPPASSSSSFSRSSSERAQRSSRPSLHALLRQQRQRPDMLVTGQKLQQQAQQAQLQEHHFRQLQLRVPYWVRHLAGQLLQAIATAEASSTGLPNESTSRSGSPAITASSLPPCLQAYGVSEALLDQLNGMLPVFQEPPQPQLQQQLAQHADEHAVAAEGKQQQQAHEEEQQQDRQQPGEEQGGEEAGQVGLAGDAGDIFAAELSRILSHYQQNAAAAAAEADGKPTAELVTDSAIEAGSASCGHAGSSDAEGSKQEPETCEGPSVDDSSRQQGRHRGVDERGFVLLLRAMALMGEGVRSAILVLLAADRGGHYPSRLPSTFATLFKLANSLQDDGAALALVQLARHWDVQLDEAMWNNVLDVCAKAGKADVVEAKMKEMEAQGLTPNGVFHTILVMAHEKAGNWEAAVKAYHGMCREGHERSSFTYRALISALVGAGRLSTALEALDWMAADGVSANAVVYQTLINAFVEREQRDKVDWLLERMRRDGVRFSHQAVARLTNFCLSRGQPRLAFQLFKTVRELGLLSFEGVPPQASSESESEQGSNGPVQHDLGSTTEDEEEQEEGGDTLAQQQERARGQAAACHCRMIAACQKARLLDEAWCVYGWMLEDGLRPDRPTYSRLISVCAYSPARRGADTLALYQRLMSEGFELDVFMWLHLVTALGGESEVGSGAAMWPWVLRVLHSMHMAMPNYRDTHVQTVAVSLAAKHGRLEDALAVYRLMLQDGVQPKSATFNALIAACMRAGQPAQGFRFFQVMQEMGVQADVVTVSTLIACCERLGDWQRAEELWQWMLEQDLEPDTVCYNTMISCMERSNQPDRALAMFERMTQEGVAGSSATYATLIDVFTKQGKWDKLRTAVQVKEWMEAQGEDPAQLTYAQLMQRASEGGNWKRALELFDGMESSLTISGSQPNTVTYSAAIIACARLADWQRAIELKDQMLARGLPSSPVVYNSVLVACEAAQQLEAGLDILDEMKVAGVPRDSYTYSTLISCCCHGQGQLKPALRLYQEMQDEGLTPNLVVVNALLSVCATVGQADTAMKIYRHATDALGLSPDSITLQCMMEVMGRAGRWAEGLEFFVQSYKLGTYRGAIQLDLSKPDTATQLDLHHVSVLGAATVLRGWLLFLKRSALQGQRLPADSTVQIVTGWGRNSANNVPRLKPEVARMLQQEMGPPLQLAEPASNLGVLCVEAQQIYDWLLNHAELGLTQVQEERAWQLMQQLREFQRGEQHATSGQAAAAARRPSQPPGSGLPVRARGLTSAGAGRPPSQDRAESKNS